MTFKDKFLPTFSVTNRIKARNATIDRIKTRIGNWYIEGEPADIRDTFQTIANFQKPIRDTTADYPLFQNGQIENDRDKLSVRFAQIHRGDAQHEHHKSLLAGSMDKARTYSRMGQVSPLKFNLMLNGTRFLLAQRKIRPNPKQPKPQYFLEIPPQLQKVEDEVTLFPATNLLMGEDYLFANALRLPAHKHLSNYIKTTETLLKRLISDACDLCGTVPRRSNDYSLQELELYWEFASNDAVAMGKGLVPKLTSIAHEVRTRSFKYGSNEEIVVGNSLRIALLLRSGVWLVVYAKTNKRIRFEIRFEGDGIPNKTSTDRAVIIERVKGYSEVAAKQLNDVFSQLEEMDNPTSNLFEPHQFIVRFSEKCPDRETSEALLSMLINYGRISLGPKDILHKTVRKLASKNIGLLIPTRVQGKTVYHVNLWYQGALTRLRNSKH